jgi:hypothetical protein
MTPATPQTIDDLTLSITLEIHVRAPLDATFAALLEQIGPHNEGAEGKPMPMKIEAWPGGRWYRNLGGDNGHLWGHVQAIKRPSLLEIHGPLFASFPFVSNVQYRLIASVFSRDPAGDVFHLLYLRARTGHSAGRV